MSTRIDLPGNHWAELRDPMDVTERDRRPLKQALAEFGQAQKESVQPIGAVAVLGSIDPSIPQASPESSLPVGEMLDLIDKFQHLAMAFFITAWSFDFEPTADSFLDIPVPVYNALDAATGPLMEEMFPEMKTGAGPTIP